MNVNRYYIIIFNIFIILIELILCFYMYNKYVLIHKEINFLIELRRDYRKILEKAEESLIKKKILF